MTGSGPWTPAYKTAVGVDQLGPVSPLGRSNPLGGKQAHRDLDGAQANVEDALRAVRNAPHHAICGKSLQRCSISSRMKQWKVLNACMKRAF